MDIIHQDAFHVRFWYIADSYGLLKVRCERAADTTLTTTDCYRYI